MFLPWFYLCSDSESGNVRSVLIRICFLCDVAVNNTSSWSLKKALLDFVDINRGSSKNSVASDACGIYAFFAEEPCNMPQTRTIFPSSESLYFDAKYGYSAILVTRICLDGSFRNSGIVSTQLTE